MRGIDKRTRCYASKNRGDGKQSEGAIGINVTLKIMSHCKEIEKSFQEECQQHNEDVARLQEVLQQWQEYASTIAARPLQSDAATQHNDIETQVLVEKVQMH